MRIKRPFKRSRGPGQAADPTLDPALIMAGLAPDVRARLEAELDRRRGSTGPCGVCGVPTGGMRPIKIRRRDGWAMGGGRPVLVIFACPDHDNPTSAAAVRAAIVADVRRRARDGLGPRPDLNLE